MRDEDVTFDSDGLRLAGMVRRPPGMGEGERRPAFLVLHGFGANKNAGTVVCTENAIYVDEVRESSNLRR